MNIASVQKISNQFSTYLKTSEREPVVITRHGRPVAILLSLKDESEIERLLLTYSPQFQTVLQTARQQIREGQGISHTDFWQEIEAEANE